MIEIKLIELLELNQSNRITINLMILKYCLNLLKLNQLNYNTIFND